MIPVRKKEDLEDIMSALEEITGEKYELSIDLEDEEEEILQAKQTQDHTPEITSQVISQIKALRGAGQPLPRTTRSFFETRFGVDFGHVRVRTSQLANETANKINARAYTIGNDIVFGNGQYSPETFVGKKLLAHELTHFSQQKGGKKCLDILL